MSLNTTTSSERIHIAFFGCRNAGKSSLVNAVTNQNLSVVSDIKGTTTDPVKKAMEILRNKLTMIEIEKNKSKIEGMKEDNKNIEFGSQIRSYVMHPYSMVKDHRTDVETSNVEKVLDGDIDLFIEGYLRS